MKTPAHPVQIILADDHPLVRGGLRAALEKIPWARVIGEANDGRETLELVKSLRPEVVFIDISMPGLNGLEALARITKEFPEVRVIVLSMHDNEEYVWRALRAGAAGYLLKKSATAEFGTALQTVMRGDVYLCHELSARLGGKVRQDGFSGSRSPVERLTDRQREILQLIAEGQNTKQIAAILRLSPKTVEYHRIKLMQALKVHDIAGLVRFALQVGLVAQET